MEPEWNARATLLSIFDLPDNSGSDPYIHYVESSWPGRTEKQDFIRLFVDVVNDLKAQSDSSSLSIQGCIDRLVAKPDHYYFNDTLAGTQARATGVKEVVLLIAGTWALMQPYFIPTRHDQRRIVFAYCTRKKQPYSEDDALSIPIVDLIKASGLHPNQYESSEAEQDSAQPDVLDKAPLEPFALHSSVGLLESLSIDARRLNLVRLTTLGDVRVTWTTNISRHMLLSAHSNIQCLELFALPCALQGETEKIYAAIGISTDLIDEIEASYATLFRPTKTSYLHKILIEVPRLRFLCWCLDCASHRLRKRSLKDLMQSKKTGGLAWNNGIQAQYDPRLETLMERDALQWDQTEYRELWPRILALDDHLQKTKPWNFWIIFRDRRDTVQYWTFLFGTIILFLTVVQVILGAAQVAGAFPSSGST